MAEINKIQFKRGSTLSNAGTPSAGEPIYDTTTKKLYIGDGSTAAAGATPSLVAISDDKLPLTGGTLTGDLNVTGDATVGTTSLLEGTYTQFEVKQASDATGIALTSANSNSDARNWGLFTNYSAWGSLDFRYSAAKDNTPRTNLALALTKDGDATLSGEFRLNGGQASIYGVSGGDATLELNASLGDDNNDKWRIFVDQSDSKRLKIASYASGSWVDKLRMDTSNLYLDDIGFIQATRSSDPGLKLISSESSTDDWFMYVAGSGLKFRNTSDSNTAFELTHANNAVFSGNVTVSGSVTVDSLNITNDATITSTAKYFQVRSNADNSKITKHSYDGLYTSGAQHQYIQSAQDIKFYPGGTNKVTFASGGLVSLTGSITTTGSTITVDPASGDATLLLQGAGGGETVQVDQNSIRTTTNSALSIFTNNTAANGISINQSGPITFNQAYTFPTSIGSSGQVLKVPSSGIGLVWGDASGGNSVSGDFTITDYEAKLTLTKTRNTTQSFHLAHENDDGVLDFLRGSTRTARITNNGRWVIGGHTEVNSSTLSVNGTFGVDGASQFGGIITSTISSGTIMSRGGFTDFIGYNANYGTYIGGGASNASRYLYAGGYFYDGSSVRTLVHSGNYASYPTSWNSIPAGTRYNYSLKLQPTNSGGFAGFEFMTEAGNGAGYFLVRSGSDSLPAYTANGISLVADSGHLNFIQRTSSSYGIRFATGSSPVERLFIANDGTSTFTGDIYVNKSTPYLQLGNGGNTTSSAIRIGGANAAGGRLFLQYAGDSSYIDCYGGHGGSERYRDLSMAARSWTFRTGASTSLGTAFTIDSSQNVFANNIKIGSTHLFESLSAGNMRITGSNSAAVGINLNASGNNRGWVYANDSSQIGFLNTSGSWDLRKNMNGELTLVVSGGDRTVHHTGNLGAWADSNRNFRLGSPTNTGGQGLMGQRNDGTFQWQLYGDGSNVGFLDGAFASWDLQKVLNGALIAYGSGSTAAKFGSGDTWGRIEFEGGFTNGVYVYTQHGDFRVDGGHWNPYGNNDTDLGGDSLRWRNLKLGNHIIGGFGARETGGTTNWNDSTNARSGQGHTLLLGNASNGPSGSGDYFHPFSYEYSSKDGSGNMCQFAIPYIVGNGGGMYMRSRYSGGWGGWVQFHDNDNMSGVARTGNTYGSFNITNGNNAWAGHTYSTHSSKPTIMFKDNHGDGGLYHQGSGSWRLYYDQNNGCMGINGSATNSSYGLYVTGSTFTTGSYGSSDIRFKENIETIDNGLEKVMKMRGVYFDWKDEHKAEKGELRQVGVIAQEINKVLPEVVIHQDNDEYAVDYSKITGVLIEAIKDLKNEINELKGS